MLIGLLLVNEEDDILEATLARHETIADCFYALDGTADNTFSRDVITGSEACAGYITDDDIDTPVVDGMRQHLYELAARDHGYDHWFLLLHADEVWNTHPAHIVEQNPGHDGYILRCPFYIPRHQWKYDVHPLDQLVWSFRPGWPELRMFRGGDSVGFTADQHFNVTPAGIDNVKATEYVVRHYPFRSPKQQARRALASFSTNYRWEPLWTDAMIEQAKCVHHLEVVSD